MEGCGESHCVTTVLVITASIGRGRIRKGMLTIGTPFNSTRAVQSPGDLAPADVGIGRLPVKHKDAWVRPQPPPLTLVPPGPTQVRLMVPIGAVINRKYRTTCGSVGRKSIKTGCGESQYGTETL